MPAFFLLIPHSRQRVAESLCNHWPEVETSLLCSVSFQALIGHDKRHDTKCQTLSFLPTLTHRFSNVVISVEVFNILKSQRFWIIKFFCKRL
ncbi:hypothetical protein F6S85_06910 [Bifidobacterium dentium]|uniref:Uncharacterized protein n=1 Tax=Bifidobacterium dentium ATCC 27679 TaxID=871562 RepID=E0QA53_9BIFI|nr:hypothetical protein BIFDEN_00867 [Bifidobacterium dentium ATCC 27678]EFM40530.1 hypothetical protein HMPREF0168_2011 [Bifidobacterium dentium ATCC 27679]NEG40480.1 hypothetical protein [Bifidobacterium dentium]TFZ22773.1 hypothetical protein E4U07_03925 [Bifidobacterium dentium]HBJ52738.1 hypothetical protein [Bifidobacterium dentium]